MLTRSLALLGALAGAGAGAEALLAAPGSTPSPAHDRQIFAYGLLIERLQAALYEEALRGGRLSGELQQFAQVVGSQEQAHVKYFAAAAGPGASTSQSFRFGAAATDPARFIATAVSLETTGLGVYNGQGVNLTPPALKAAARVVSVEARHAAWARALAGELPAPVPVDVPVTVSQANAVFRPFLV
jgi:hypothetical protein